MVTQETIETCILLLDAIESEVAESKTVKETKNKVAEYKLIFSFMQKT